MEGERSRATLATNYVGIAPMCYRADISRGLPCGMYRVGCRTHAYSGGMGGHTYTGHHVGGEFSFSLSVFASTVC